MLRLVAHTKPLKTYIRPQYNVAALRICCALNGDAMSLGRLLQEVGGQDMKKCDREKGGCDAWQVRGRMAGVP